jgi:hypothetical protein
VLLGDHPHVLAGNGKAAGWDETVKSLFLQIELVLGQDGISSNHRPFPIGVTDENVSQDDHEAGAVVAGGREPDVDLPAVAEATLRAGQDGDVEAHRGDQLKIVDDVLQLPAGLLGELEEHHVVFLAGDAGNWMSWQMAVV